MIGGLLRVIIIGGAVVAVVIALLFAPGDFSTSEERQQSAAVDGIRSKLAEMSHGEVAEAIGSAVAYAQVCSLTSNDVSVGNAIKLKGVDPDDIDDGGRLRVDFLRGATKVAELAAADGGEGKNRDLTCKLGMAAFGAEGTILPGLIQ